MSEENEDEKWEKIWKQNFGSTTDLTPSILAYYDSLKNSNNSNAHWNTDEQFYEKFDEPTNLSSSVKSTAHEESKHNENCLPDNISINAHKNILSQNVQRIIAHSERNIIGLFDDTQEKVVGAGSQKPQKQSSGKTKKHFQMPLTKNTCKNACISKASNELVGTIHLSDNEKSPAVDFEQSREKELNSFGREVESTILTGIVENENQRLPLENIESEITTAFGDDLSDLSKQNIIHSVVESDSDEYFHDCLVEAKNMYLEKQITKANSELPPRSKQNTLKLTYSRAILSKNHTSAPSIVTDPPPNSAKVGNENLPLETTHRPLSMTSICSTSSSSSSGSEPITRKLSNSYLASIESLADHSGNETFGNNNLTTAERAAMEIIDSEKSYVADIGEVIKGYLEDWKRSACLKDYELKTLFSNIKEIYEFNSILLERLIEAGTDSQQIAKCFIELKDGFEVYTIYCTSYPAAISLLTSILQASHTKSLLASTQKLLKHTLPLGSYLLKPVQRILKYHLLLDNLRKHIESDEVTHAHILMREVARNIDQVKRHLEQQSRVKELSGILDGWLGPDLTVLGELRQEGPLLENNKPRVVFLFETMFIITKPKEDKRLQFKTYIPCKNLMLVEHIPGDPTSFNVLLFSDPRGQIKLTARTRDHKRQWAHQIKQAMLAHFDIPNRAKELVFKLGDEEDRNPDKQSWKWNTHQSSTPEYLERRNQYRRSEMRHRSKKARKNVVTTLSLEDSNFSLKNDKNHLYAGCDHKNENCQCKNVKTELSNTLKKQGRRKTEPVVSSNFFVSVKETANPETDLTINGTTTSTELSQSQLSPCSKSVEIKMYNTKTLPKRIANLKKSRMKSIKETSKFYTELPQSTEINEPVYLTNDNSINTVLKITESTDNIHEKCLSEIIEQIEEKTLLLFEASDATKSMGNEEKDVMNESITSYKDLFNSSKEKSRKDSEIVTQLVLENKDFNKVLNRPPKKKSVDNFDRSLISSPALSRKDMSIEIEQDLDAERLKLEKLERLHFIKDDLKTPEPIYESLLRNVHVPYKFAPALLRSISQQYQRPISSDNHQLHSDSDYVTLAYVEDRLISVGDDVHIPTNKSEVSKLRNSDSNINYHRSNSFSHTSSVSDELVAENQPQKTSKMNEQTLHQEITELNNTNSQKQRFKKSLDSVSIISTKGLSKSNSGSVKEHHSRQSISYKQGSEDLGSRIAHVDYADPRSLFHSNSSNQLANVLINKSLIKSSTDIQRDSVFSSSSDSVYPLQVSPTKYTSTQYTMSASFESDSFYENHIDDCLENDFRDSAVYSDDNEKRNEFYSSSKSPSSPGTNKNVNLPPPIPVKPRHLSVEQKRVKPPIIVQRKSSNNSAASAPLSPDLQDNSKNCSWVLQQVRKFQ